MVVPQIGGRRTPDWLVVYRSPCKYAIRSGSVTDELLRRGPNTRFSMFDSSYIMPKHAQV